MSSYHIVIPVFPVQCVDHLLARSASALRTMQYLELIQHRIHQQRKRAQAPALMSMYAVRKECGKECSKRLFVPNYERAIQWFLTPK